MTSLFARIGVLSFGGVLGQLAMMHGEVVDRRRWLDEATYLRALNFCMLLPGPEAQQLATFIGWRLHGWKGAAIAGSLFVLPGALVIWGLSWLAAAHGQAPAVMALFAGVKPVVVGIVVVALWRLGRKTLDGVGLAVLALAALVLIRWLGVDFPLIVLGAGLVGLAAGRLNRKADAGPQAPAGLARHWRRLAGLLLLFAVLWAVPVGLIVWAGGSLFAQMAQLFTQSAFVTFGGAYAVLPYIADAAVNTRGWLTAGEMINGLALAETTPGPTILVLQYVGFLAAWKAPGALDPLAAATLASVLVTYVTFLPSFLFILAGAPAVEWLGRSAMAAGALKAIAAAVVGVMANLALFFGEAVLLSDGAPAWDAIAIAAVTAALMLRLRVAVHWLVLGGAVIGLLRLMLS